MRQRLPEDKIKRDLERGIDGHRFLEELDDLIHKARSIAPPQPPINRKRHQTRNVLPAPLDAPADDPARSPRVHRNPPKSAKGKRIDLPEAVRRTHEAIKRQTGIPPRPARPARVAAKSAARKAHGTH
jgi:hypothetical protein